MIFSISRRFIFKYTICLKYTMCLGVISIFTGCTINSGLQTGEIPPVGTFVADNGMQFNVQPLSLLSPTHSLLQNGSNTTPVTDVDANNIRKLLQSASNAEYLIDSSDVLSINLVVYPELTSSGNSGSSNPYASGYPVDQQGYIQFPLIGRIKARGLSVPQFTENLRSRLQRYLKYPDPQVKIVNYRGNSFFIDGEVKQSGEFSITDDPVSLYNALSLAGGTTPLGDSDNITLNRQGKSYTLGLRTLQDMGVSANDIYLQDGDSVHVNSRDRNKVYVLGEFGQVKPLEIPEQGLSLAHVLGESRGLNSLTANAAQVYVVRDHPNMNYADIYYVDMQTITNLPLANRFQMHSNDIVYVDPTGLTRWSRFINAVLPSTTAIRSLSGL